VNNAQRLLVIAALVVIGTVLAWLILEWGDGWGSGGDPIFVFYENEGPNSRAFTRFNVTNRYGIYAVKGIPHIVAILCGVALPLCLFRGDPSLALEHDSFRRNRIRSWQGSLRTRVG
jgi:hypothetical protein